LYSIAEKIHATVSPMMMLLAPAWQPDACRSPNQEIIRYPVNSGQQSRLDNCGVAFAIGFCAKIHKKVFERAQTISRNSAQKPAPGGC
jgi:hypothetical protein